MDDDDGGPESQGPWVIEIVAPVGLRATYGLRDGDEVTLELIQHEVERR